MRSGSTADPVRRPLTIARNAGDIEATEPITPMAAIAAAAVRARARRLDDSAAAVSARAKSSAL
jgi:hypothetical protein